MAFQDKVRYQYEMAHYRGPLKVAKSTRQKKDPEAPKRPTSAFQAYSRVKEEELKKENPTMKAADLTKRLANMWKTEQPSVREYFTNVAQAFRENYRAQMELHKKVRFIEKQQKENEAVMKALCQRESMKQLHGVCPASALEEECVSEYWEPLPFFEIKDVDFEDFLDVETSHPTIGEISPQSVHNPPAVQAEEDGPLPTEFLQRCGPVFRGAEIVGSAQLVTPEQSPREVFLQPHQLNHAAIPCNVTPEKNSTVPTSFSGNMCVGSSNNNNNIIDDDVVISSSEFPVHSISPPAPYKRLNPFSLQHFPPLPDLSSWPMPNNTPASICTAESGGKKSGQLTAKNLDTLLSVSSQPIMTTPWK